MVTGNSPSSLKKKTYPLTYCYESLLSGNMAFKNSLSMALPALQKKTKNFFASAIGNLECFRSTHVYNSMCFNRNTSWVEKNRRFCFDPWTIPPQYSYVAIYLLKVVCFVFDSLMQHFPYIWYSCYVFLDSSSGYICIYIHIFPRFYDIVFLYT